MHTCVLWPWCACFNFFLIPTRDGQCLYWEAYPHICMISNVWHRAILCPCLCMQLGLRLWFIFFVILDDGHNCDTVMMILSVELCQSCIIGSFNFVYVVLTLSTILKFLRVLLLSMNNGGDVAASTVCRFGFRWWLATDSYIVQFQKWKKMMDLFSYTFGSFYVICNSLPNLDENDTLFLLYEFKKE